MATEEVSTLHQRVADGIRSKIISGEYPVGTPIPSTKKLEQQFGVSQSAVRQGVSELKTAGILVGQPGKAVYVKAKPDAAAAEKRDIETLSTQVASLEKRAKEEDDLRDKVSHLETFLIQLYDKTGHDYPKTKDNGQQRRTRHG